MIISYLFSSESEEFEDFSLIKNKINILVPKKNELRVIQADINHPKETETRLAFAFSQNFNKYGITGDLIYTRRVNLLLICSLIY